MSDSYMAPRGNDYEVPEYRAHRANQFWDVDWICDKARSLRLNPLLNLTDRQRADLERAVEDMNIALGRNS